MYNITPQFASPFQGLFHTPLLPRANALGSAAPPLRSLKHPLPAADWLMPWVLLRRRFPSSPSKLRASPSRSFASAGYARQVARQARLKAFIS